MNLLTDLNSSDSGSWIKSPVLTCNGVVFSLLQVLGYKHESEPFAYLQVSGISMDVVRIP